MAVRRATSDPKPSHKNPGFQFFYYSQKLPSGSEACCLIPDALSGIVRKGFIFDDAAIRYDEALKSSILELDFDEPQAEGEPALPAEPDAGWRDHDHLTAAYPAGSNATELAAVLERSEQLVNPLTAKRPDLPPSGVRPATARKRAAAARAAEHNLNTELWMISEQVCAAYNYIARRVGSSEKPGAVITQKLTAIAYIAYSNKVGIALSDDEQNSLLNA